LLWRVGSGQPVPLAVSAARGQPVDAAHPVATAEAVYAACVGPLVAPLLEATAQSYPISRKVLWGNVASAVAGATAQLARSAPDAAVAVVAVGRQLLAT